MENIWKNIQGKEDNKNKVTWVGKSTCHIETKGGMRHEMRWRGQQETEPLGPVNSLNFCGYKLKTRSKLAPGV